MLGCYVCCSGTRWSIPMGRAVPAALHLGGCAYSGARGILIGNSCCRSVCFLVFVHSLVKVYLLGLGLVLYLCFFVFGVGEDACQFVTTDLERLPWLCTVVVNFSLIK